MHCLSAEAVKSDSVSIRVVLFLRQDLQQPLPRFCPSDAFGPAPGPAAATSTFCLSGTFRSAGPAGAGPGSVGAGPAGPGPAGPAGPAVGPGTGPAIERFSK